MLPGPGPWYLLRVLRALRHLRPAPKLARKWVENGWPPGDNLQSTIATASGAGGGDVFRSRSGMEDTSGSKPATVPTTLELLAQLWLTPAPDGSSTTSSPY